VETKIIQYADDTTFFF